MPGEKTEKPTPKKRRDARKEGNVFKSMEINNSISILTSLLLLSVLGPGMIKGLKELYVYYFTNGMDIFMDVNQSSLSMMMNVTGQKFFLIAGPMVMILLVTGMSANFLQVGFLFVPKTVVPKPDRINPISGFKKMVSLKTLINLIKSILKVAVVAVIAYNSILLLGEKMGGTMNFEMNYALKEGVGEMRGLAVKLLIAMVGISLFDYVASWFEHEKKLKMDKQEVKDEQKNTDGDPQVKSKIKNLQRQMANSRMMQSVPDADVIITNPTHYAVAVKYDKDKGNAPIVLAKGVDLIAQKIKEVAKENKVSIVENKQLARALYSSTRIGDEIPQELFQGVAEILAYIYSLKKKKGKF
jgi:flagellar biosynthetic protein FlhB